MMSITPEDLGADEDLGRRVLVKARIIAPCLDSLDPETDAWKDAIAVLRGVIAELPAPGQSRIRSLSRNGSSMSFDTALASAFTLDVVDSLRSICGHSTLGAMPLGSFPAPRVLSAIWPEGPYS